MEKKEKNASAGNRTRAARVTGVYSTTEPTMLHDWLPRKAVVILPVAWLGLKPARPTKTRASHGKKTATK